MPNRRATSTHRSMQRVPGFSSTSWKQVTLIACCSSKRRTRPAWPADTMPAIGHEQHVPGAEASGQLAHPLDAVHAEDDPRARLVIERRQRRRHRAWAGRVHAGEVTSIARLQSFRRLYRALHGSCCVLRVPCPRNTQHATRNTIRGVRDIVCILTGTLIAPQARRRGAGKGSRTGFLRAAGPRKPEWWGRGRD